MKAVIDLGVHDFDVWKTSDTVASLRKILDKAGYHVPADLRLEVSGAPRRTDWWHKDGNTYNTEPGSWGNCWMLLWSSAEPTDLAFATGSLNPEYDDDSDKRRSPSDFKLIRKVKTESGHLYLVRNDMRTRGGVWHKSPDKQSENRPFLRTHMWLEGCE